MLNNTYQDRLVSARRAIEADMITDALAAGYPDDVTIDADFTMIRSTVTHGDAEIIVEVCAEGLISDSSLTSDSNPLSAPSVYLAAYSAHSGDFFDLSEVGFPLLDGMNSHYLFDGVTCPNADAPRAFTDLRDFVRENFVEFMEA